MDGRDEIRSSLEGIFGDHQTATYVGKVRSVRPLGEAALLLAVAGMIPPDGTDLNENLAIQSLVAAPGTARGARSSGTTPRRPSTAAPKRGKR